MNSCLTCRYRNKCLSHNFVVGYCSKYKLNMKIGTPVIFNYKGKHISGIFNGGDQVVVGSCIYSSDDIQPIEWGKDIIEQISKIDNKNSLL